MHLAANTVCIYRFGAFPPARDNGLRRPDAGEQRVEDSFTRQRIHQAGRISQEHPAVPCRADLTSAAEADAWNGPRVCLERRAVSWFAALDPLAALQPEIGSGRSTCR